MKDQTFSPGIGSMVPPERKHVEIYFIAQGATEEDAAEFYDLYTKKKWRGNKGLPISNWKQHAWRKIWYGK